MKNICMQESKTLNFFSRFSEINSICCLKVKLSQGHSNTMKIKLMSGFPLVSQKNTFKPFGACLLDHCLWLNAFIHISYNFKSFSISLQLFFIVPYTKSSQTLYKNRRKHNITFLFIYSKMFNKNIERKIWSDLVRPLQEPAWFSGSSRMLSKWSKVYH